MARINIEEDAIKRAYKLADYVGCDIRESLGTLSILWGDSQEILKTHGTKEEIVDWARLHKFDEAAIDRWFNAFIRARIISQDGDLFLIRGNKLQIENRVSKINTSSKGGEATKKKWEKIKATGKPQEGFEPSTSPTNTMPEAGKGHADTTQSLGTIQCNASQGSSIQTNSNQNIHSDVKKNEVDGADFPKQELIEIWGVTLKHFKINKDPNLDDSVIADLRRRHGFEKTRLALIGQRFEPKTQSFDPAKYISITRFKSKPDHFEKMVNLGAQDQTTTSNSEWSPPETRGQL